tara:strand:- start:160 stop:576 length:417 start_codon:yes stop_codon:yes gene_type:complete
MAKILYLHEGEADNTARIAVDGKYIDSANFVGLVDNNIHAIQWNGSSGEIEYKDNTPNKTISDISSYNFEKKFSDEEKVLADAEAKAEVDRKASMTYADKRREKYPPIEDQLDDIYHNGIDGWKTTIKAVKDKYPKGK